MRLIDMTGWRRGAWTVLRRADTNDRNGVIRWWCRCDCGVEKPVSGTNLRSGKTLRCSDCRSTLLRERSVTASTERLSA